MIAMNTYIIVENMFWLECSWRKHHGVHRVKTYKEIVDLLMDEYDADEARTLEYDQMKTIGMNDMQFFNYLEESGRSLSCCGIALHYVCFVARHTCSQSVIMFCFLVDKFLCCHTIWLELTRHSHGRDYVV